MLQNQAPHGLLFSAFITIYLKSRLLCYGLRDAQIYGFFVFFFNVTCFDWVFVGQEGVLYCVWHKNKFKN